MNRITSAFGKITLASATCLGTVAGAQGNEMELLKSRVSALESRVAVLESSAASTITDASWKSPSPVKESVAPAEELYVIKEGDTISEIARKLNVPRSELMEANGIREGQQIFIGDQIKVPGKPTVDTSTKTQIAEAKPKTNTTKPETVGLKTQNHTNYTVRYGDTLSKISRQFGVSVAAIKTANGLRSDTIGGGQRLKIPTGGTTSATVAENTKKPASNAGSGGKTYENPLMRPDESYGEYTVAKGDNLYALARDFFTTMKELQRLNGLGSSSLIYPGDKIVVPTSKYNEYHNKVASR